MIKTVPKLGLERYSSRFLSFVVSLAECRNRSEDETHCDGEARQVARYIAKDCKFNILYSFMYP